MISLLYVHKIFPFHQADACVSEYTGFISTNQIILNSVNVYWNYRAGARHWANPGGCRDGAWGPRLPANEPGALPPPRGLARARHPARVRSRLPAARPVVVGSREARTCFLWCWCLRAWGPWLRRDPVSHRRRSYPGSRRRQVFLPERTCFCQTGLTGLKPRGPCLLCGSFCPVTLGTRRCLGARRIRSDSRGDHKFNNWKHSSLPPWFGFRADFLVAPPCNSQKYLDVSCTEKQPRNNDLLQWKYILLLKIILKNWRIVHIVLC